MISVFNVIPIKPIGIIRNQEKRKAVFKTAQGVIYPNG